MNQKLALLKALDIPVWLHRPSHDNKLLENSDGTTTLKDIETCVAACQRCDLHKTRKQTVFGVGNTRAHVMIIGEAPGFNEDQQGEPFVGRAGQLLNAMLQSIGLARCDVYIANILKCRPPNNRDPLPEEVEQCTSYLQKQVALIQPKILCAVGRIAAQYLLKTTVSISKLRGKIHVYGEIPLLITYHPAYLLRNSSKKAEAYQDLLQLKEMHQNYLV